MTAPTSLSDICHEADIKTLVDSFYDKVNHDEQLGPTFNSMAQLYWPSHLLTMYDFWSSTLLGTMRFTGESITKHVALPLQGEHFQRWLNLFNATVEEKFAGPKAE